MAWLGIVLHSRSRLTEWSTAMVTSAIGSDVLWMLVTYPVTVLLFCNLQRSRLRWM
jgi:hypothetical protein